jgi:predicted GIY-YIG superfamily endonuclease
MKGFIYIMANDNNTVLYIGVTSDLKSRVKAHKEKLRQGSFTSRYNIRKLVYFECIDTIGDAIKSRARNDGKSKPVSFWYCSVHYKAYGHCEEQSDEATPRNPTMLN